MPLDLTGYTIVFDLDGTLVDTAPDLAAAANHVLELVGVAPMTVAALQPFIGHGSRAMIDAGLRARDAPVPESDLDRLHERFLAFYAEHVAVSSRPFEGVPELLEELRTGGAKLAVCTNKVEHLSKLLLAELGLASRLAAITGRDTFEVFKPAPGHLTRTITMAGGDPARAVMVGDSEVDIATSLAAGIPSIAVTFGYATKPVRELGADVVIEHYREFMPALHRLLQRQ